MTKYQRPCCVDCIYVDMRLKEGGTTEHQYTNVFLSCHFAPGAWPEIASASYSADGAVHTYEEALKEFRKWHLWCGKFKRIMSDHDFLP